MRMSPSGSSVTSSSRIKTRRKLKPRRSHSLKKKKKQNPQNNIKNDEMIIATTPNNDLTQILGEADSSDDSGCSTPKAQRYRIPQVSTCPPPPKKPKSLSNCSFRRSPIPFFASPELELFFLGALRDISV